MKILLFIFCLFFTGISNSQEPPKMPKYVSKNAAGIFYYDVIEATKKIKLKKDDKKTAFSKELRNYNSKIKEIAFLNTPKLNGVDLTVNAIGEQAFRDADLAEKVRKEITENVLPVRDSVIKNEKKLNANLKEILDKKQYKKWLKYQRSEKQKLLPEQPRKAQNLNSGMNRRNGMGLRNRRF